MNTEQQIKSLGTTTIGIVGKGCVVLAADKRATMGSLIAAKNVVKIHPVSNNIGLTIAGSVADAQKIVRIMRSEIKLRELDSQAPSIKGVATLLSNIMHGTKYMPFMNQFIMGGIINGSGLLYDLDPSGGLLEYDRFTSTGSGSPMAYGVLEDGFSPNLSQQDAIALAVRGIKSAMARDINSGEGIDVALITNSGFKRLSPQEIQKYL